MGPHADDGARLRPWRILAVALPATALILSGLYAYPSLVAWYHFRAAQAAAERNDVAGEEQHLRECLKGWKTDAEIYLRAARAARRLSKFDEADRYLVQCQRFTGDSSEAKLERLLLNLDRHNPALDPRLAFEFVRRAPENHPAVPEALEGLSKIYLDHFDLQDALAVLTLWIERQPNNAKPFLLRGWVFEQLAANPQRVLADYRRAVELDAANDVARLRLAEALVKTRRAAEALPELETLLQRQPANPIVQLNLALCCDELGESQRAVQLLDALLSPQRLAQIQEISDRLRVDKPLPHEVEEADWYRQAMSQAPYGSRNQPLYLVDLYIQALVQRAKLAARAKKGAGEQLLRQAVKLDPFDYAANYQLMLCVEQRGNQAEARRLQTKVEEIRADASRMSEAVAQVVRNPHDPAPRCVAAEILLRNGQPQKAVRWLRSVLQQDPNYSEAVRLWTVYQRLKLHSNRAAIGRERDQTAPSEQGRNHKGAAGQPPPNGRGPDPRKNAP
jgi:tetratricopeptide (TPR) repeat protein